MRRVIEKLIGSTRADAAPCFGCDGYYQYRCLGTNTRQRRWVTTYGCRCQYRSYTAWTNVGACPV